MMTKLTALLILAYLNEALNIPLRQYRELKSSNELLVPQQHSTLSSHVVLHTSSREKKSPNIISIPIQQLLIPKYHVIPLHHGAQSNVHHSTVHTNVKHIITHDNIKIPIISQTVSHSTANITHPTSIIPILIPIHHNLVPVQDLSVIPLQKNIHKDTKLEHYSVMEKKDSNNNEDEMNRFRTFYGGFGTGLFFGGQGAGHGFHIFG
ncbi:uncharacterized protein LOC113503887 [Trichoplusia ni]|uniref:Uncharacterized protein LOC113503861 n=1 Tax=Trichoplusia ni TaxID=7111 RepID=A0A7E5WMB8_TRINI|nr:uncharacterized protein LOC113503861 [Trichoplusia ni]XP_026741824.1 uncharacterized protein LOC113503887 [Trichoplusia ni]